MGQFRRSKWASCDGRTHKEHKQLKERGDDTLKGTRYDWLRNPVSMEPKDRREFASLRNSSLATARAYALKKP